MATESDVAPLRLPVTKERVFRAAIAVADQGGGVDAITMRKIADELDIEPMSIYYHVPNKEAVLDGVAEAIVAEVQAAVAALDPPIDRDDWKTALRRRILAARSVMLRHKWAPAVFESRTETGLAAIKYFDAVVGHLRDGGFSYDMAHHAIHVLGSRALGFVQELFEPEDTEQADEQVEAAMAEMAAMADQIPNLVGMMAEIAHDGGDETIGWCDDQTEFEFGLDLILDGLERLRETT
jgi:AcrR family transcriptional regulator